MWHKMIRHFQLKLFLGVSNSCKYYKTRFWEKNQNSSWIYAASTGTSTLLDTFYTKIVSQFRIYLGNILTTYSKFKKIWSPIFFQLKNIKFCTARFFQSKPSTISNSLKKKESTEPGGSVIWVRNFISRFQANVQSSCVTDLLKFKHKCTY